ncbi:MAG: PAS domain-containing protein [Gammaproteobacteria bacterium]
MYLIPATAPGDFNGPLTDATRLAVLRATGLLGPEQNPDLDRYGNIARRVLDVAACYISFTDDRAVFIKSAVEAADQPPAPLQEPAEPHISCAYVAVTGRPLAVPDLREDPRFRQHALDSTPHLAAYLGVPLKVCGQSIGAVCVMHDTVREWTAAEIELLSELADAVGKLIEVASNAELSRLSLERTEGRLRRLALDAPLVVFQTLPDGSLLYANPYTEEFVGQPQSRLRGMGWVDFVHPEFRDDALAQVRQVIETGKAGGFELPVRRADGAFRTVHVRAQPVRGGTGEIEYWSGIGIDVEERKQAEAQMRTSQNMFRLALDAGQLGFWVWNVATNEVAFDGHWAQIVGYELDELAGNIDTWIDLVHPQDMPRVQATLNAHLDGRTEYYETEHRLRHRDGSWRWVLDRGRVVERTPDGRPLRALGTHADITARKEAEHALQRSEGRLQLAMGIAAVATWDSDLVSGVTHWSKSYHTLFGLDTDTRPLCPSMLWQQLVPAEDRERLFAEWSRAEREQDVFRCEHRIQRPEDGRLLWMDTAGRFFFDAHGRAERVVGVCVDITERKQSEAVLQESARRKDEFLAMLAHELRNPLAPIVNAVELLRGAAARDEQVAKARAMIERQTNQLVHLVDDLLDVSRVSRGRIVLQKAPISLGDVLLQAVETMRPQIDARGHRLSFQLPERPLHVDGDFTRLTQVISNLLSNAAKYTDAGGHIEVALEVRASGDDEHAVIRVRDNGRGIDSHTLNHVFELFFQADNSLDRAEGGLGIGLSLVKRLVEKHGGRVTVHSAGRGHGSEFVVRLPLLKDPVQPAAPAHARAASPRPATRILLVDDNRDATDSLAMLLQMHGHDVISAYEGRSALDLATREQPSLILVDIGLPDIDGFEVARRLRADPRTAGSTLVALTGYGQPEDREKSRDAGFDHHLVKPAAADVILGLVTG